MITLPAVTLSIGIAALCAYALACTKWKGRDLIFIAIFAMQIVPLQMALVPLLQRFVGLGMAGTYLPVWIAHAAFGMPLCVFLLHNFMSDLPESLFEAARVDGAGHATIFSRIVLPLCVPAIAALLIFQFLFIWNDLLVGLTFAGGTPDVAPLTVRLAELAGTTRQRVATTHRWCRHRHHRADDRLPLPAAVLHPRPARRWPEGLTAPPPLAVHCTTGRRVGNPPDASIGVRGPSTARDRWPDRTWST